MLIFKEIEQLLLYIKNYLNEQPLIISIDGKEGSGKSTLSKTISDKLGFVYIELDSDRYLEKNKGQYVKFISYDTLKEDITKLLENRKNIVIEGICILKILNIIGIKPSIKIYIKRMSKDGHFWYDEKLFDYSKSPDEIIEQEDENLQEFIRISAEIEGKTFDPIPLEESIFHEIIRYHFEYKPDLEADIIFERPES